MNFCSGSLKSGGVAILQNLPERDRPEIVGANKKSKLSNIWSFYLEIIIFFSASSEASIITIPIQHEAGDVQHTTRYLC